jgi:hypothetical protein
MFHPENVTLPSCGVNIMFLRSLLNTLEINNALCEFFVKKVAKF